MNTIRRQALLWEQQSQADLYQLTKTLGIILVKTINLVTYVAWAIIKFVTTFAFWLLAGSRPVIQIDETQYVELSEVYPSTYQEPATQIQHLGRKA